MAFTTGRLSVYRIGVGVNDSIVGFSRPGAAADTSNQPLIVESGAGYWLATVFAGGRLLPGCKAEPISLVARSAKRLIGEQGR